MELSRCDHLQVSTSSLPQADVPGQVDEYWAGLHPLQHEIIPVDLSFDDMLDGHGVASVTGVTATTQAVVAVAQVDPQPDAPTPAAES